MKLIKCHINGFGTIVNKDIEFDSNLSSIIEENGFGKSTLAAFIRAMFYGIGTSKVNSKEDKRSMFRPWDSDRFGGSLTFSLDNEEYTIIRVFDSKSRKKDEFEVLEKESGKEALKFKGISEEKFGEEIFGVDEEGFMRSTFSDGNPNLSALPSSIREKIGVSLEDGADDMDSFDSGISNIKKIYTDIEKRGKRAGLIAELEEKISENKTKIEEICGKKKAFISIEEEIKSVEKETSKLLENREKLEKEVQEIASAEANKIKKENYVKLLEEIKNIKAAISQIKEKYKGEIPSEADVLELSEKANKEKELEISLLNVNKRLDTEESKVVRNIFENADLTDEEIKNLDEKSNEITKLEYKINDRKEDLNINLVELEELNVKNIDSIKNSDEISALRNSDNGNSNKKNGRFKAMISVFAVLASAGIALCFVKLMVGVALIILSLLCLIFAFTGKKEKAQKPDEKLAFFGLENLDRNSAADVLLKAYNLNSDIKNAEKEIKESEDKTEKLNLELKEFLAKYGYNFDGKNSFENFKLDRQNYVNYVAKDIESAENLKEQIDKLKEEIATKTSELGIETSETDFDKIIYNIRKDITDFSRLNSELSSKENEEKDFAHNNNIAEIKDEAEGKSMDEVKGKIAEIDEKLKEKQLIIRQKEADKKRIAYSFDSLCEEEDEAEGLIADSEPLIEEKKEEARLLKETEKFLENAKISFTKKYAAEVTKNFAKYSAMFLERTPKEISVSPDMSLSVIRAEKARDMKAFSSGQQSAMDVCLRLSLIDTMFKKEKPFLILDDPFANMDNENLKNATELIKNASKECQVIYLTCHESRKIN